MNTLVMILLFTTGLLIGNEIGREYGKKEVIKNLTEIMKTFMPKPLIKKEETKQ